MQVGGDHLVDELFHLGERSLGLHRIGQMVDKNRAGEAKPADRRIVIRDPLVAEDAEQIFLHIHADHLIHLLERAIKLIAHCRIKLTDAIANLRDESGKVEPPRRHLCAGFGDDFKQVGGERAAIDHLEQPGARGRRGDVGGLHPVLPVKPGGDGNLLQTGEAGAIANLRPVFLFLRLAKLIDQLIDVGNDSFHVHI